MDGLEHRWRCEGPDVCAVRTPTDVGRRDQRASAWKGER